LVSDHWQFSHIGRRFFDNGMLEWSVLYEGDHAILTVEQHAPDQASTFLLLMLGLLGLVTFRRQFAPWMALSVVRLKYRQTNRRQSQQSRLELGLSM